MKLQNKVIVITGAGSGIGKALTEQLLARGSRIAAIDINQDSLNTLTETHEQLSIHPVDITDRHAVNQLPKAIIGHHGQVDGIINCAGIIQPFVAVNELEFEAIEKVMNVNFYGTLHITKAFLPHLLKRPQAALVNVSSMGGFLPVPGQSGYGASKAAVKLLTEGLYAELLDTNVRVSIVFPGATDTNITRNSGVSTPDSASDNQADFPMLSATEAAQIIVKGIEQGKPRIFTGKDSKSMDYLYRLSPIRATKFITKQMASLLKG